VNNFLIFKNKKIQFFSFSYYLFRGKQKKKGQFGSGILNLFYLTKHFVPKKISTGKNPSKIVFSKRGPIFDSPPPSFSPFGAKC
jgi:hypothetical protein